MTIIILKESVPDDRVDVIDTIHLLSERYGKSYKKNDKEDGFFIKNLDDTLVIRGVIGKWNSIIAEMRKNE